MLSTLIFYLLILTISVDSIRVENDLYLKLIKENDDLFKFYNPNFDKFQSVLGHVLFNKNLSIDCKSSLIKFQNGLKNKEEWALKCKVKLTS